MDGRSLEERVHKVLHEVQSAVLRAKRAPDSVRILAVSKSQPEEKILELMGLGFTDFGENYVQEWKQKAKALSAHPLRWHFIGHLQSNKVKDVVGKVELIHSVDRPSLAEAIARRAQTLGIRQSVLLEVNLGGEASKNGCPPEQAQKLLEAIRSWPSLVASGMMVMPPLATDPEDSRLYFRQARELFHQLGGALGGDENWRELSMGTSGDFAVAIEEGATMVRLGTMLFGPRTLQRKEEQE